MSAFTLDGLNTLESLPVRNAKAKLKITDYAVGHALADALIGGLGGVVPGMGPAAIAASIALQVPVYQRLVTELGAIYCLPPDRVTTLAVLEGTALGAGSILAADFGVEFMSSIARDILSEAGLGLIASFIPVVSIFASAALDMSVAATMTWRVGTMTSIYFQNGHRWVGDRTKTYEIAKELTGGLSPETNDRVNLDTIYTKVPQVCESQTETAMGLVRMLRKAQPNATEKFLRDTMSAQGLPDAPIDEALKRLRFS